MVAQLSIAPKRRKVDKRHKLNMAAKRRNSIAAQFNARLIEMLESPAYRVLTLAALRVLARIEIELAHHGGNENGELPVTFDDFVKYGVPRTAVGPAIAELVALGFIVLTSKGRMSRKAEYRRPNLFLLTTREGLDGVEGRCGWRRFKTLEEAQAVADVAREVATPERRRGRSNSKTASSEKATDEPDSSVAKSYQ